MFSVGIELLLKRAVITSYDCREKAEWPPHPDRIFMCLVAGFGDNGQNPEEEKCLEWLESCEPPSMSVSLEVSHRSEYTSYVPVNDTHCHGGTPMGSLPIGRVRQARRFPAVTPASPVMHLCWNADLPNEMKASLESLCSKVTYLGHSSTPIRMWVENEQVVPNYIPGGEGNIQNMRIFGKGRLAYLKDRYANNLRPQPAIWKSYGTPKSACPKIEFARGVFDSDLMVFRKVGGREFPLESSALIAESLRDTLMKRKRVDIPSWLSGHDAAGGQAKIDRPAIMPLSFAGREHADGHLLGVAIALPRSFSAADSKMLMSLLCQHGDPSRDEIPYLNISVKNGEHIVGILELELDERTDTQRPSSLKTSSWTRASHKWTTATPIVLPRYPRQKLTAEDVVCQAVVDAGFPKPISVQTSFSPFMEGVPHVRSFSTKPKPGRLPKPLLHAKIEFENPVFGPLLVGSGRFNGFGTCKPTDE